MKSFQLKRVALFFSLLAGIIGFYSCKKDKQETSTPATEIAAPYEGKFGTGTNTPSSFYSFNLKEDGTLEEVNNAGVVVGKGTWSIQGNSFQGYYHYLTPVTSTFSVTATYDQAAKKLSGTWGYGSSNQDGGKWFMVKKN
jgi:hypothetical protein